MAPDRTNGSLHSNINLTSEPYQLDVTYEGGPSSSTSYPSASTSYGTSKKPPNTLQRNQACRTCRSRKVGLQGFPVTCIRGGISLTLALAIWSCFAIFPSPLQVKCDAVKPSCAACRKSATAQGRNPDEVLCEYDDDSTSSSGKKAPRKSTGEKQGGLIGDSSSAGDGPIRHSSSSGSNGSALKRPSPYAAPSSASPTLNHTIPASSHC